MDGMAEEQLKGLKPGDVVETGGIFPGLSKEKCLWEYLGALAGVYQFKVTYCGVGVGHMFADTNDDNVTWRKK